MKQSIYLFHFLVVDSVVSQPQHMSFSPANNPKFSPLSQFIVTSKNPERWLFPLQGHWVVRAIHLLMYQWHDVCKGIPFEHPASTNSQGATRSCALVPITSKADQTPSINCRDLIFNRDSRLDPLYP